MSYNKPEKFKGNFQDLKQIEKQYKKILTEYYQLSTSLEVYELDAKRLDKILEQAESDECLSFLLNEIDELTYKELGFYEQSSLENYKNQKAKFKDRIEFIELINSFKLVHLSQWFDNIFEKGWKRSGVLFSQLVMHRDFQQKLSTVTGIKQIDSQLGNCPIDLIITLIKKPDQKVGIKIQGHYRNYDKLPSGLELIVIDESGKIYSKVSTEINHNNFQQENSKIPSIEESKRQSTFIDDQVIQVPPFSGHLKERFALQVVLEKRIFTEYFVI